MVLSASLLQSRLLHCLTIQRQISLQKIQEDLAYKVKPRAIKDYDDSVVTVTSEDITIASKIIEVESAANISPETYFEMDGEQIYVKKVTGNKLSVDRGRDNTKVSAHVKGTQLKSITVVDTSLLDFGDDFGFDGNTF